MKAILVEETTQNLFIGETDMPHMGKNDLLIKVKATALNRADLLQKRGLYPPPSGASPILGLEMSGVIEDVGVDVRDWKKGDRVCALLPGGGYAEYAVIPADMAIKIPENLSFEEAAAIPEVFLTAFLNMFWLGKLKKGETILIHAGASGVGTAAIQLAREIGAKVIVTAGTDEKRSFCRSLGADADINYKEGPFLQKVMDETSRNGVNLIFDFIGAPYWEQNIESLAVDGKLILIGTMGGAKLNDVNLGKLLFKRIQVIGTALRSQSIEKKIALTKDFVEFALPKFKNGQLKPIIDSIWDWDKANDAHLFMEQNKNAGKIVLQIS
ncbi:NAD(P)H-quinone oxidoreductase [Lederbergia wuyishanensis]|uniref:PIG3 family NAD(P)H quinone oxidoreductase n=1 Tax=Lederbergia wuyishanensis TaxID=1347903 RepID=A0ABU0D3T0_9BACI|nr:NAD(P)H-quinone oxidoreductase [Lederbergia wuyishanensis]MCJ8007782.1 NAD(P)H-quinone oxidoreductase [Lederbergia wuyishanensis]MDQ0343055.1 putative PIG3 family NAD(P)H quinone oxidoreductase [Lederbergia wuyishanensis]